MKFHRLTRFPKHSFPVDLETDDTMIDSYLRKLDAGLVGSTGVRRLTLEETRDHLLEQKSHLLSCGDTEYDASRKAITDFGEPELHAKEQRKERYHVFLKMFFSFGGIFASLMLVMSLLSPSSFLSEENATQSFIDNFSTLAGLFVFNMGFYGFFMSYWYSFAFTPAKPAPAKITEQGDVLEVYSQRSSKYAAVFLFLVMGGIALSCLFGIFGYGYMAASGVPLNIILLIIAGQMAFGAQVAWTRYELTATELKVHTVFGTQSFKRSEIINLVEIPMWRQFLITRIGKQFALVLNDIRGKTKHHVLVINGEMHNGDQLIASLKAATSQSPIKT